MHLLTHLSLYRSRKLCVTNSKDAFRGRHSSVSENNGSCSAEHSMALVSWQGATSSRDKNTRNAIAERSNARRWRAKGGEREDGKDRGAEARRCGRGTKARDIQPYRSVYIAWRGGPPNPHKLMPMYLRGPGALYV